MRDNITPFRILSITERLYRRILEAMTNPLRRTIEMKQVNPASREVLKNIATTRGSIRTTKADILLFPELFLSGYQTSSLDEIALHKTDGQLQDLITDASEAHVSLVVGYLEQDGDNFYDSFFLVDGVTGAFQTVRKTHLFGAEHSAFGRGNALDVISLSGINIGFMNCVEIEFPEIARTLALKGAALFLVGSANMHPYANDHRIACEARAVENKRPLVYVNRVGQESGFDFCGESRLVSERGEILVELNPASEESRLVTVELGQKSASEVDFLAQLRPELYLHSREADTVNGPPLTQQ